jgi:mannose-6-phosphate isomerase-like protein (cupin superfamily)
MVILSSDIPKTILETRAECNQIFPGFVKCRNDEAPRRSPRGLKAEPLRSSVRRVDYDIRLDDKYGSLTLIDVAAEAAAHEPWFNQTLTTVNDAVVRLGVLEGDFHWHKHDTEDEFFLVLSGRLIIEVEGHETVELGPQQGYTVPRGVMHITRAPVRTAVLMVEAAGVEPTGD